MLGQVMEVTSAAPKTTKLFLNEALLPIKLNYSIKELKSETNDSIYVQSKLEYQDSEGSWDTLEVKIRARGNFRRANCYYAPVKMKIKKAEANGTLFKGNKELKLVFPCLTEKAGNDNVIEEYMAYKIFEQLSPYHFKTRLFDAEFIEERGRKQKVHQIKGFFIEDISRIAKRFECNRLKRSVHPLQQDGHCSTRNAFFQFMIGNTDFSTGHQHNEKLLFVDKKTVPVPYDFDMSGLVNASYSTVSQIGGETLPITSVRERLYRGFKRDMQVYDDVRAEFLSKKEQIMATVDTLQPYFENSNNFDMARSYIEDFFKLLANDSKFKLEVVTAARIK
ncbi:MAG: hypothetical protein HKP24_09150 [Croceitalea sp.]|nr:hypothetical protein [Croceitalea sp.]NNM18719.1 hypothetical protein [Croceitalea sp.]